MLSVNEKPNNLVKKSSIISFFSVLSVSLFPAFFMYFYNTGTAAFKDFIEISSIIALVSVAIFVLNVLILRNIGKGALITNIIMAVLLYFAYIEKAVVRILPMFYYWHVALICLFVLVHIVFFIRKKVTSKTAEQFNSVMLLIFAGLILFNGVLAIPKFIRATSQNSPSDGQRAVDQVNIQGNVVRKNLPNVYYFIFDEYAGYDNIKRYCDYDNSNFYNALEELGFVTSKHAVNETIDSYTEIPNLLQLNRVNTVEMTAIEKKKNLKNPYLFTVMKNSGYSVNALDSTNYDFIDVSQTDTRLTAEFTSTHGTFTSYIIQNTAFYPFYGNKDHENEIDKMISMFDYGMESSKKAESNLFTIGYFSFPHVPYIVDQYGNKTNDTDRLNLKDPNAYLGQYIYASNKIIEMVREIIKNDPGAVIILQSDHGFRLPSHLHSWYGIDEYDLAVESPFERNILNAVYYRGESVEIEGLSGLDTLKVILNNLLDTNFEIKDNE